ncbi:beta-galactosidase [Murimonas intestini]|uniref:Beta-galactosidase n=1 Tax=Murimonas intestini TaxID=1337051 RepID=A0AB73SXS7_9FIRM|nr:beta-galactosidase [Murimonas intestini]MCR1843334.1 beta-galactosidase [Murimonas intestini]MCR1865715.1 beta-galactosidase [Murimonas intestini]MCR1886166.1 beta-galactosidase [Murimonas intestini]
MYYGAAYYPEHKTAEELEHDMILLIESGINTVRMGEFAWCRMEPREGEYQFDWLEAAVERLGKAGIRSIICTPTACPPAWLVYKHPEVVYVDNRGLERPFGGRRFYCYNNPVYREYSRKITEEIGRRFGKNPYVCGFQIDNEPAQEASGRCHCPVCQAKFSEWLKDKYKTIEEYNRRSGNIFWGQDYDSFDQIRMPVNTIEVSAEQKMPVYFENPTLRLEYERFCSESQIEYQDIQSDVLHGYTEYPVTTNGTGLATNSIDYYKSTRKLDCYGFDYYPGLRDAAVDSFPYAFARGVKDGAPFWVMEFMSGGGHRFGGSGRVQPNPGALKQAVLQSFAHGAEMMLHFQFRTFPFGAEQLNYAIVDMDGVPRRRYYEMQETARLLKELEPLENAGFANEIAICVDYDTHWALRIKPVNDPDFKYLDYAGKMYHVLEDNGYNSDVISYDADFSKYKFLIVPSAFVASREFQQKLRRFTEEGGILLGTFLTSAKNEDNVGYTDSLPAGLTDVFGAVVEEVEPVFKDNHTNVRLDLDGSEAVSTDGMWSDILGGSARAIGTYTQDYKTDSMVISENTYGKGTAVYMGTDLEKEAMGELFQYLCRRAGISKNPVKAEEKIEVVRRVLNGENYYYVFNFTAKEAEVSVETPVYDYLKKCRYEEKAVLERNGFAVLKEIKG